MSEMVTSHDCFDETRHGSKPVSVPTAATPQEMFRTRHTGHRVVPATAAPAGETIALKCVDCEIGFAT